MWISPYTVRICHASVSNVFAREMEVQNMFPIMGADTGGGGTGGRVQGCGVDEF